MKPLKAAFTWLEDRGVGGKKSSGYGCFTCEFIDDYSVPDVDDPRCWVTVSCTIPKLVRGVRAYPLSTD